MEMGIIWTREMRGKYVWNYGNQNWKKSINEKWNLGNFEFVLILYSTFINFKEKEDYVF